MVRRSFGRVDGEPVDEVVLTSGSGAVAGVITWGAVLRDLVIPTPRGPRRVVLGLNTLEDYLRHSPHFGAIAGRYANRIRGGRFTLDGVEHELPRNENGRTSLHGGGHGFGKRPWALVAHDETSATLALRSPDGDAGYPGNLDVTCTYRLAGTTLRIELTATTDRATPVNLCHHSYFNLDGGSTILDHELEIAADLYTPLDADNVPTGEVRSVAGTPYDFRAPRPIRLEEGAQRHRYDDNWLLRRDGAEPSGAAGPLAFAGRVRSQAGPLSLEVWTTEPAMQVYDGYKLDLAVPGLDGERYGPCAGLCLEPQHVPDSPNQPHFPSTILRPGAVYRQVTEYRFA
ncbi:aldose epimerase family protein [Salinarimonas soli]|uniref:Aldose 1-epimerase n=1 Tax=Salinarimonas soli TaxID=1638099 RepID=A0A5B2V9U3_9HYPH|nr:aldose epimerase family protein [Salinarimonas soli]KAA2235210.1 galactose mutarotase [Salinarimonas soli]